MESNNTSTRKLFKKISRKVGVTLRDQAMIDPGDHILIGLSGGKDSMVMLEVLAERRNALPFQFDLSAAHISVSPVGYKANIKAMQALCDELGIELIMRNVEIKKEAEKEKGICFLCSWQRRKALFDLSLEIGACKLALGHHRYDALETLLINMIYHGSISSMPFKLKMFDGRMYMIRPMLEMDEHLLQDYATQRNYMSEGISCLHEKNNQRIRIRELINTIEEMHGRGTVNMFRSMDKIYGEYLPQKKKARTS